MKPSDYTNCDIDKLQAIDNENYQWVPEWTTWRI